MADGFANGLQRHYEDYRAEKGGIDVLVAITLADRTEYYFKGLRIIDPGDGSG